MDETFTDGLESTSRSKNYIYLFESESRSPRYMPETEQPPTPATVSAGLVRQFRRPLLVVAEYGMGGRVPTKGDTYSYGIMLLETFTRKKPTEEMFTEELSLRQWVSTLVPNEIGDVFDENLLNENAQGISSMSSENIYLDLLELGLGCSRDSPEQRFEMKDVVAKLNKIKLQSISE